MSKEKTQTTPSTNNLPNEELAKRLTILRAAVMQRINSSVSLIKATAKYVQELNAINDEDIKALVSLDKQIEVLTGSKPANSGGTINVPKRHPKKKK